MRFAKLLTKLSPLAVVGSTSALVVALALGSGQAALAQGPGPGGPGFRRPSIDAQAFNACTTTDYGSIVAKALGTNVVDIRKGLVAGQSLQAIATSVNGDVQGTLTAYQTARKADIDQAIKDGVMTQDEATILEATPTAPGTPPAGGPGNGGQGNGGGPRQGQGGFGQPGAAFPDISTIRFLLQQSAGAQGGSAGTQPAPAPGNAGGPGNPGAGGPGGFGGGGFGLGLGGGIFNLVKQYEVAATALNMKCTDLVKTLITPPGKAISAVAAAQNVDPKTISDALTKAYKDALAQDVTDGVITQAQSDQLSPLVDKAVSTFVANPLPMGPQVTPTPQA